MLIRALPLFLLLCTPALAGEKVAFLGWPSISKTLRK